MRKKSRETGLTELESHVLSIVWRNQPATAYQVRHAFAHSPTRDLALSQGSIYPAIERLKRRGFVASVPLHDRRKSEHLSCTRDGEEAVRAWICDLPNQLPDDPLRSRILALPLLSKRERAEWVRSAKASLLEDLAQVEEVAQMQPGLLFEMAQDNARSTLLARIRWVERVEQKIEFLE